MTHPRDDNFTAFEFEPIFITNETMQPILVTLVKATYTIATPQTLTFDPTMQMPVCMGGETWGDPQTTSYQYEPEVAFIKPHTDVILMGDAISRRGPVSHLDVYLNLANIKKTVKVFGHRQWVKSGLSWSATQAKPFEAMPLTYEHAFGGYLPGSQNTEHPIADPRNPFGVGYRCLKGETTPLFRRLPNLENPKQLIQSPQDQPEPIGFGFTMPNWSSRIHYAGTYDKAWQDNRMPLLPTDFDRRFLNAAPPDQILETRLQGNERVIVRNASKLGDLDFCLPGIVDPICEVDLISGKTETLQTELDTVIINTKDNLVLLLWRQHLVLNNGVEDINMIRINSENAPRNPKKEVS